MPTSANLDELLASGFSDEEKESILSDKEHVTPPEDAGQEETPPEEKKPEEAAPAEAAEPKDEEEAVAEPEPKKKPKWLQRVDEEKSKRLKAEADLAELSDKWTKAEKRVAEIAKLAEGKEEKQPEIPDPNKDAFGHLAARLNLSEQALNDVLSKFEEQRKEKEQQTAQQAEYNRWQREFEDYKKTAPDIMDGMNFLANQRRADLKLFFPDNPELIEQSLEQEGSQIIQLAHSRGKNPAELFYEAAKLRGYKANGTTEEQPDEKSIKRIADGQKKAQVLGSGSEGDSKGLTLESLFDMPQDDYENLLKTKFGDNFNKLRRVLGT